MAEILKKIADFLQIEEDKPTVYAPKRQITVSGIPPVPRKTTPIKPIGTESRVTEEQWKKDGEIIDSNIELAKRTTYLKAQNKPVRPLQLQDHRRNL